MLPHDAVASGKLTAALLTIVVVPVVVDAAEKDIAVRA